MDIVQQEQECSVSPVDETRIAESVSHIEVGHKEVVVPSLTVLRAMSQVLKARSRTQRRSALHCQESPTSWPVSVEAAQHCSPAEGDLVILQAQQ